MTDYSTGTGTYGTLILRDNGSTVQAIIRSSYSGTYTYGKSWSITGGVNVSGTFSIQGAQEVVVWSGTIGSTTTLNFTMGATGTQGLGGPTTLSVTINRTPPPPSTTVPGAPGAGSNGSVTQTSFNHSFTGPSSNGGKAIDSYQTQIATNSGFTSGSQTKSTKGSPASFTGLAPGTRYYVRTRAHNANGYGKWSGTTTVDTVAGAYVKVNGAWHKAVPYVKVNGAWKVAQPYVKASGSWKATVN